MDDNIKELEARRDELRGRIEAIHRDLGRGLEKDYEEQSIQLENLEVLQEIARVTEQELRAVEMKMAALKNSNTT
jgi:hypothetical protein